MSPPQRRGPWSQTEDSILMQLIHSKGALNWVRISTLLGSRSPKQCRERFHQNLKPTLNHDPITPEEGHQIELMVNEMGKRWAEIARRLKGRSDNAVKNWWNGSQNRRKRLCRRTRSPYEDQPGAAADHVYHHGHHGQHQPQHGHWHPQLPLHPHPHQHQHQLQQLAQHQHHHGHHGQQHGLAAIPRALPPPTRQVPPPLDASAYGRSYALETALPSPGADSVDMPPSLVSDTGSCYTTSPQAPPAHLHQPLELPPLKNVPNQPSASAAPSFPTGQHRLPALGDLKTPSVFSGERRFSSQATWSPEEAYSPRAHLPTAPSSPVNPTAPVNLPALRQDWTRPRDGETKADSRTKLSAILN